MLIGVLGDLHGKLLQALERCVSWEAITGKKLDLILQLGDFGVWPFPDRLDKATKRYAEKDSSGLGFCKFTEPCVELDELFSCLTSKFVFIPGNHEDFEFLKSCETSGPIFPVDVNKHIWCLRSGQVFSFVKNGETIRVGGLGGVDTSTRPNRYVKEAYINSKDADKLVNADFDIFISHDGPRECCEVGKGSLDIVRILKKCRPGFAFFAHYAEGPFSVQISGCSTKIFRLNKVFHFDEVLKNSFGILDTSSNEFKYVA